jgi:ABC-type branched-subunit amino acid transport system substrate-binding protein
MRWLGFFVSIGFALAEVCLGGPSAGGKIGYGSSTASISAAYQENVFLGFELALQKTIGKAKAESLLLSRRINDKTVQGATLSAEALVKEGAVALVGFPVSHDAVLAADVAKKHGLFAMMGGAAHSALAEKGPTVYTTGASIVSLLDILCEFILETFPGKRGLEVMNPYAVFSVNQEKILRTKIDTQYPAIRMETRSVNQALILSEEDVKALKAGKYDYLYLTLYPDDLVALLNQLTQNKIDLPMVAFGGPDPDILRRFVGVLKSPYYIGTTFSPHKPEYREVEKEVKQRFGKALNMEMVSGYKLGLVVGQVIQRLKGPLTAESMLAAFHQDRCFDALEKKKLCFGAKGGHADSSTLKFTRFTEQGLTPQKPVGEKK